jgi:hypothetical protein
LNKNEKSINFNFINIATIKHLWDKKIGCNRVRV